MNPLSRDAGTGWIAKLLVEGLKSMSDERLSLRVVEENAIGKLGGTGEELLDCGRGGVRSDFIESDLVPIRASRRAFNFNARWTSCKILGS